VASSVINPAVLSLIEPCSYAYFAAGNFSVGFTPGIAAGHAALYKAPYVSNLAKAYRLKPEEYLSVHSGPGVRFSNLDQLTGITVVYICDEEGDSLRVFYRTRKWPCGPISPTEGLDVRQTASCKSGWVRREQVDISSG
jgi:hypothetical protein